MLVLARKIHEEVWLYDKEWNLIAKIGVAEIRGSYKVRLSFAGCPNVMVLRKELVSPPLLERDEEKR